MADVWVCKRCDKINIIVQSRFAQEGHMRGVCASCSTAEAKEYIDHGPAALGWYVDRLQAQIKSAENELREEARYAAAMAEDAEWERRHPRG